MNGQWLTPAEGADLLRIPVSEIEDWIRDEKVISLTYPDGKVLVYLFSLQNTFEAEYDLDGILNNLNAKLDEIRGRIDE